VLEWRLVNKDLRSLLHERAKNINLQLAHFTWDQVNEPRTWSLWKVKEAIGALQHFVADLSLLEPDLAGELRARLTKADLVYMDGPKKTRLT